MRSDLAPKVKVDVFACEFTEAPLLPQAMRTWATGQKKDEPEARPDSFLERFAMAGPGAAADDKEEKSALSYVSQIYIRRADPHSRESVQCVHVCRVIPSES